MNEINFIYKNTMKTLYLKIETIYDCGLKNKYTNQVFKNKLK